MGIMEQILNNNLRDWLKRELPLLLEKDQEVREILIEVVRPYFAGRAETEDRFEKLLDELRKEREENLRRWEENNRRWEENNRRWEENQKRWEENNKRWEENNRRWEENNKRWEENQKVIKQLFEEIKALREKQEKTDEEIKVLKERQEKDKQYMLNKIHSTLGAIGARWGIKTEESFRRAICRIFKEFLPEYKVSRYEVMDEEGEVFGFPAAIELDLIIKNGKHIVAEIKSGMSFNDIAMFLKKARFYEKKTGRKADALWIISPMVDEKAKKFARKHKISIFSCPEMIEEKG